MLVIRMAISAPLLVSTLLLEGLLSATRCSAGNPSTQQTEMDASAWYKPNITKRSGHHHHVLHHTAPFDNGVHHSAGHHSTTLIRAPVASIVPSSLPLSTIRLHAVPSVSGATSTLYSQPTLVTVVRRPVVHTSFVHAAGAAAFVPNHGPHAVLPLIQHAAVAPAPGSVPVQPPPQSLPVYEYATHPRPPVRAQPAVRHHHHHHHQSSGTVTLTAHHRLHQHVPVAAKPLALSNIPIVLDPVEYNRRYRNTASNDEVIIKERDLAQLLQGRYTQFAGSWNELVDQQFRLRQDRQYQERRKRKHFYSGVRGHRSSRRSYSRQRDHETYEETQGPNLSDNGYSSALRSDRAFNGRNIVVVIPKK